MHVTAFLKSPQEHALGPAVVVYGKDRFLKQSAVDAVVQLVLGADEEEFGATHLTGKETDWKTVCDELLTVSMWGESRLIVIDDADEFVSKHRATIEKYLDKPAKKSVLLLSVKSWPKTTRLAKKIAKIGTELQGDTLSGAELTRWLTTASRDDYGKQLAQNAAKLMVELAGSELGLLDQELSKLAAYVGERDNIGEEDVSTLVGGWKAETTWVMTNAVRDGNLALSLECLDNLLRAGEAPQRILGGINFVFRKMGTATELARKGTMLNSALQDAGIFPRDTAASARYLRRIGRPSAEKICRWLLNADSDMKGGSRAPQRIQLERLLVRLSGQV